MKTPNKHLIVFVKAPVPGQCKTRLIPLLGELKACEFYKSMLNNCLENISGLSGITISIHVYPDLGNPFLQNTSQHYGFQLLVQQGKDLGERMFYAMQQALKTYSNVVLIGSDCPSMSKEYIDRAFDALNQHDIVFGPAEDGGYVLLGANKITAALFKNISWSTQQVLQQSLAQANNHNYKFKLLDTLRDIDTPEDYLLYQSSLVN